MESDASTLTIREVLDQFFEKNNLGEDGGLNKSWAWLKVGRFYIPFPNTESRKKALVFHDIHHLVTGYRSNWKGEAEIGAWEVSTGCEDFMAAWVLDLWSFCLGLLFFPKATYLAFIRGRRTLNLYKRTYTKEELMGMNIPEIQSKLLLDKPQTKPATAIEILSFIGWSTVALTSAFIPFALPYILLGWWLMR